MLQNLIEFREREWKVRGIRVRNLLAEQPMTVLGSHGQLEQVFLNLLVHAEQSLTDSSEKLITIRTSMIARRFLIEIGYSGPRSGADPFSREPDEATGGSGLGVCRSLITGHGGDIRLVQPAAGDPTFQVELPRSPDDKLAGPPAENGREAAHLLTALVIEPAEAMQTQLRGLLAASGYRVVPVSNSDEGLDLAERLRFDVAFCSVNAPGLNWVETAEQLKSRVGGFVLLTDSYDAELASGFEAGSQFRIVRIREEHESADTALQLLRGFHPVQAGRIHRAEGHVETQALGQVQAFVRVAYRHHAVAAGREQPAQLRLHGLGRFDHQRSQQVGGLAAILRRRAGEFVIGGAGQFDLKGRVARSRLHQPDIAAVAGDQAAANTQAGASGGFVRLP